MATDSKSLDLHKLLRGKLSVNAKCPIENARDLSLVYTPGVADVCAKIIEDPDALNEYTIKSDTVAVVTNGTAVLGLGDIGPAASLPVMEGKCALFKRFGGLNAFPVCVDAKDPEEFVNIVKKISTPFAGINLEDIKAPQCFDIEKRLIEELDIPVFHDDQHGTAIVTLAALINALKVTGKKIGEVKIVILGAGAAGTATAKLLKAYGAAQIVVCDSKGILRLNREDIVPGTHKYELALLSEKGRADAGASTGAGGSEDVNPANFTVAGEGARPSSLDEDAGGTIADAMRGADVFIGMAAPNLVNKEMVASMNEKAIVFAMANPVPEIMPAEAEEAGALVTGTGRSDMKNQINNVLAFPGIFMGAIEAGGKRDSEMKVIVSGKKPVIITDRMKLAAATALAALVPDPAPDRIIPGVFDPGVAAAVANAVKNNLP